MNIVYPHIVDRGTEAGREVRFEPEASWLAAQSLSHYAIPALIFCRGAVNPQWFLLAELFPSEWVVGEDFHFPSFLNKTKLFNKSVKVKPPSTVYKWVSERNGACYPSLGISISSEYTDMPPQVLWVYTWLNAVRKGKPVRLNLTAVNCLLNLINGASRE